jgi:hypothetical protein
MFIFGYLNYIKYVPPQNYNNYYQVSQTTLLRNSNDYEGHKIIINGRIENYSVSEKLIVFETTLGILRLNCSLLTDIDINLGDEVYFRGISYLNSKDYVLINDYHVVDSYSLELSLIGLVIVILILFLVLRFNWKSFSFEIKEVD